MVLHVAESKAGKEGEMNSQQRRQTEMALQNLVMHDIPGMTVTKHHGLCVGILACCYKQVDADLKRAISEAFDSAQAMGMNIQPECVTGIVKLSE